MRKLCAALLVCACLCTLIPLSASAAQGPIFVFNDAVQLSGSAIISQGGKYYIPYETATRCFGANYIYEGITNTFVLYNSAHMLAFDLNYGTCSVDDSSYYSEKAFVANSTFYVPAIFVTSQLGYRYTVLESNVLRAYDSRMTLTPAELLAQLREQGYLNGSSSPVTPPSSDGGEPAEPQRSAALLFLGLSGAGEALGAAREENFPLALFVTREDILAGPDIVRAYAAAGEAVGLLLTADDTPDTLARANDWLQIAVKSRTTLLYASPEVREALGEEALDQLSAAGYRIWSAAGSYDIGETGAAAALRAVGRILENRYRCAFAFSGAGASDALRRLSDDAGSLNLAFPAVSDTAAPR